MNRADNGWNRLRRVFRLPATSRRLRDELDEELRFHLEGRIEDIMEREGLTHTEAEREATRRFGDYQAYRSETRSIDETMLGRRNRMELLDTIRRETGHAFFALRRTPAFSLIALVTLALGLGATTTIFTVLDRVVLRPLPYAHADRLVHIGTLWPKVKMGEEFGISKGQYFYFKNNSSAFENVGLYDQSTLPIPGDGDHPAERVSVIFASASLFDVLGIRAEKGRQFIAKDNLEGNRSVAMISRSYWARRFGSDPAIIGKRLPLGANRSLEIVGVLPPSGNVPDYKGDIWIPNSLDPSAPPQNEHTHHAIGLLKPGVAAGAASADVRRLQDAFATLYPNVYSGFTERVGFTMNVTSMRDAILGPTISRALWIIFAAVGVVLLIAAANVANLFLVRIDARRREMAVRSALGASKGHLAIHYLTESILLSLVAGVCAVALGYALLHAVLVFAPQSLPRLDEVHFDAMGVAFCLTSALLFGIVFGLLPLGASALDLSALREGGRGMLGSRNRELARRVLVVSQVCMAVVLLTAAALMVKSFSNLRRVKPGFDPTGVQTMTVVLPFATYQDYPQVVQFFRDLSERVAVLPGVKAVGYTDGVPLDGGTGCTLAAMDAGKNAPADAQCMPMIYVSPGYFAAMGIPVSGSSTTWSDLDAHIGPVVVSKAFGDRYWPGESAIGHRVLPFNSKRWPWLPVVGVAADVRHDGLQKPPIEAIYLPLLPGPNAPNWNPPHAMTLVVRAPTIDQGTLATQVRRIAAEIDASVPIANVVSMERVVAHSMAQTSFTMLLLLIASTIAIVLSAVGIYGVIAYVVGQRRSEIGVRMALGAQIGEIARMVVEQSIRLALIGSLLGLALAFATTRLLEALLFEVRPSDPVTLVGTCLVLLLVAVLASAAPARRAAKVNPVEAMRG